VMLDAIAGQLERYMDLLSARQKLVASNIANADTPGYQTQDIDFQAEFRNAAGLAPQVQQVAGLPTKNDGNNVSLDREARLLAENDLRFTLASQLMRAQLSRMRAEMLVENLANAETTRTPEGGPYRRKDVVFETSDVVSPFASVFNTQVQ